MTAEELPGWVFTTRNHAVPSGYTVYVSRPLPDHDDDTNLNVTVAATEGSATFTARVNQATLQDFQGADDKRSTVLDKQTWARVLRFVLLGQVDLSDGAFFDKLVLESRYDGAAEALVLDIGWYEVRSPKRKDSMILSSRKRDQVTRLGSLTLPRSRREQINLLGVVHQCASLMQTFQRQSYADAQKLNLMTNGAAEAARLKTKSENNLYRRYAKGLRARSESTA